MVENRQAIVLNNWYVERFKKMKATELNSMKNLIVFASMITSMITNTSKNIMERLTIEGTEERELATRIYGRELILFTVLWIIFVSQWMIYVYNEEKLIESGEHPLMNSDENEYEENLESLRKSIHSLNRKWKTVHILMGIGFVLQCFALYLLYHPREVHSEDPSTEIQSVTEIPMI